MPNTNLTHIEAQERANIIKKVHSYEITLDLTTGNKVFLSKTKVKFSATEGSSSFIDAITNKIYSINLNGKFLDPTKIYDDARIQLFDLKRENEVEVVSDAMYMHSGEGMHRSVDPSDGEVYLYTQFEVPDARRVYAVFEQPDLKSIFKFKIIAPSNWVVISNGKVLKKENIDQNTKTKWYFHSTNMISSYITAILAGPYIGKFDQLTSSSGKKIPLSIYARRSMFKYIDTEYLFKLTKQGFKYYESIFKTPYPFDSYDQVFVPDFNAGAMENAGCVTYRDEYVFRSKISDARLERRDLTFLHELAHMWFGNLVTMKWWNDLWLNESFAEFMSTLCLSEATKWKEAWTTFSIMQKAWAYRQDQLSSTHPIMANIRDIDDIQANFDGITYAKGASVLKQLVAWIGKEKFLNGIVEYFREHAWGNTDLSDLIKQLNKSSCKDLNDWTEKWLMNEGVNIITYSIKTKDSKIQEFILKQDNEEFSNTVRPHMIGIGFYNLQDNEVVRDSYFEIDIKNEINPIHEFRGKECPDFILINDNDLTYAKILFDTKSIDFIKKNLYKFKDSLARAVIYTNMWEMVRSGQFSSLEFIDFVIFNIKKETQSNIIASLLNQLKTTIDLYVPDEKIVENKIKIADTLYKLLINNLYNPDAQHQFMSTFTYFAQSNDHLKFINKIFKKEQFVQGIDVDKDLNWLLLNTLIVNKLATYKDIEEVEKNDNTILGKAKALYAKASIPTVEAKKNAWHEFTSNKDLSNTMLEYIGNGFNRTNNPKLLNCYVDLYFQIIDKIWKSSSYEIAQYIATIGFPMHSINQETLYKTDKWLKENLESSPSGLIRCIQEGKDSLIRALKVREASYHNKLFKNA